MDQIQLIDRIAAAVKAALSSPEYCFLGDRDSWWTICMTRSEWASWAQVIGTVLAIVASAAAVRWQQALEQGRREKSAAARALAFAERAEQFGRLLLSFEGMDAGILRLRQRVINELIPEASSIQFEYLSPKWAYAVHKIRLASVELSQVMQERETVFTLPEHRGNIDVYIRFTRGDFKTYANLVTTQFEIMRSTPSSPRAKVDSDSPQKAG
ncbi:hypothetical protein [Ottowia sp. VDI28]|uniref:hypothetical protein n=1 Tax=Ottowia sp. VDI28 TaxID=3133968 RepID=UPI003C2E8AB7